MPGCSAAGLLCRIIPEGFAQLRNRSLTGFTGAMAGALKMTGPDVSLRRAWDMVIFCSVFTFNFYSPWQDYGLESTFGVEKTGIIENKFTFSFIEIPDKQGKGKMSSLFISLFILTKSFKTIAASIFAILIPPCRVCEISDPPIT